MLPESLPPQKRFAKTVRKMKNIFRHPSKVVIRKRNWRRKKSAIT